VDDQLLDALAASAIAKICDFHAQNLANIAWAYAGLSVTHETLMAAIAK